MTPNNIIAALLDIASAANSLRYCVATIPGSPNHRTILREDLEQLEEKLAALDILPQANDGPPLTGTARARHYMQAFLEGQSVQAVKEISAAEYLATLPAAQPNIEPVDNDAEHAHLYRVLRGMHWSDNRLCVVNPKDVGFGTQTWSGDQLDEVLRRLDGGRDVPNDPLRFVSRVVGTFSGSYALADQVYAAGYKDRSDEKDYDPRATQEWQAVVDAIEQHARPSEAHVEARDKLLADTATTAHKIYNDADLLESLRSICGYIENGSGDYVTIGQDDATGSWTLKIGSDVPAIRKLARRFHSSSFHQVIRLAADEMIQKEMCEFCGLAVEFPCTEPPVDVCSTALRALPPIQPRYHTGALVARSPLPAVAPAGPSPEQRAREHMVGLLTQVKTVINVAAAKRIISEVGGVRFMADIPDSLVAAVIESATRMLRAAKGLTVFNMIDPQVHRNGVAPATVSFPPAEPYVKRDDHVPGEETFAHGANKDFGTLSFEGYKGAQAPQQDDQPQGQGGEFDGGGASGDWKE